MNKYLLSSIYFSIKSFNNNIKTKLKNSKSIFYYFSFAFILIMYFIFFNSSGILPDHSAITNTDLNKEVDVGSTKLYITRCEYNSNKKFMEIEFKYTDTSDFIKPNLNFTAKAKVNIKEKLNVKTIISTDDTYIIHVENVPKNYDAIAVKVVQSSNSDISYSNMNVDDFNLNVVSDNTNNDIGTSNNSATIYCDYRKVNTNNNLKIETQQYYLSDITTGQINDIKRNINTIDNTKKNNNSLIITANKQIDSLNNEYKYEIKQEQSNTTQKINSLKANIKSINQQNKDLESSISSLQDKIKKLSEKINDITKKPNKRSKPILKKPV